MLEQGMAKIFWTESKDPIAAALIAYALLRAMMMRTEDTNLLGKLQNYSDEWSDIAVGVLNECYSIDKNMAHDLLVQHLTNWGNTSCMLIAHQAKHMDFISQTSCQSLLSSIWMGKLRQDNASWQLLLCVIIPPLASVLPKYNKESQSNATLEEGERAATEEDPNNANQRSTGYRTRLVDENGEGKCGPPIRCKDMQTAQRNIRYFFKAPVIISMCNLLSYIVFLVLYSYILLFNFKPNVSHAEIVLIVWVFTIVTEEIRQAITSVQESPVAKFKNYIKDVWNKWDVATLGLFVLGIIMRLLPKAGTFEAARVILAINFVSFCLRLLQIFSLHKTLGPKLVMIGRMVQDLMSFLVILMVFIVSYAIASYSILFPNSPLSWSIAFDIMRKSYWHIYGELFLDEIEECTNDDALSINGTMPGCSSETVRVVVAILLGLYMLLVNILLLNLLIAMFSNTFSMVHEKTDKYWNFQRCCLIIEYCSRPVLSPPLNIFWLIYLLLKKYVCKSCNSTDKDTKNEFRKIYSSFFLVVGNVLFSIISCYILRSNAAMI